jgi:hypothetical protein
MPTKHSITQALLHRRRLVSGTDRRLFQAQRGGKRPAKAVVRPSIDPRGTDSKEVENRATDNRGTAPVIDTRKYVPPLTDPELARLRQLLWDSQFASGLSAKEFFRRYGVNRGDVWGVEYDLNSLVRQTIRIKELALEEMEKEQGTIDTDRQYEAAQALENINRGLDAIRSSPVGTAFALYVQARGGSLEQMIAGAEQGARAEALGGALTVMGTALSGRNRQTKDAGSAGFVLRRDVEHLEVPTSSPEDSAKVRFNREIDNKGTGNRLSGPASPKSPPATPPSPVRPTSLPPRQGPATGGTKPPSGGGQPPGSSGGGGQGGPGSRKPYVDLATKATPEERSLGAWLDEQAQSGKLGLIKRVRGMPEAPGRSGNPDYHLFFTDVDNAELNKLSKPQDLRGDALIAEGKNINNIIDEAGKKVPRQADVVFIEIGARGQSGQISDEAIRAWKLNDLKTTFPSLRRLVVIRNSGGVRNNVLDLEVR